MTPHTADRSVDKGHQTDLYCSSCDDIGVSHEYDGDGGWVCLECEAVKRCSDPDWSDECVRDLETVDEAQKGLCSGCRSVIQSWSDGTDSSDEKCPDCRRRYDQLTDDGCCPECGTRIRDQGATGTQTGLDSW